MIKPAIDARSAFNEAHGKPHTAAAREVELRLRAAAEILMGKQTEEGALSIVGLVPPDLLREIIDRKRSKNLWDELNLLIIIANQIDQLYRQAAQLDQLAEAYRLEREALAELMMSKYERSHEIEDLLARYDQGHVEDQELQRMLDQLGIQPNESIGLRVQLAECAETNRQDAHSIQQTIDDLSNKEREASEQARQLRERADELKIKADTALLNDDFEELKELETTDDYEFDELLQIAPHNPNL